MRVGRLILGEAIAVSLAGATVGLGLGVLASELVVRTLAAATFVWSRMRVARLILGEAIAVSLAGATVGLGLGVLASELVVRTLAAATFVSPEVTVWVLARGLLIGFALGVIGALFSVWRVMRVPPLRAIYP